MFPERVSYQWKESAVETAPAARKRVTQPRIGALKPSATGRTAAAGEVPLRDALSRRRRASRRRRSAPQRAVRVLATPLPLLVGRKSERPGAYGPAQPAIQGPLARIIAHCYAGGGLRLALVICSVCVRAVCLLVQSAHRAVHRRCAPLVIRARGHAVLLADLLHRPPLTDGAQHDLHLAAGVKARRANKALSRASRCRVMAVSAARRRWARRAPSGRP